MLLAQMSDLHLCAKPLQGTVYTGGFFKKAVASVLAFSPRPDAVVLTGDLVERGSVDEYLQLRAALAPLSAVMPVHLQVGNHDDRAALRAVFGVVAGEQASPFHQYAVEVGQGRLVVCDTVEPGHAWGSLCAERLDWLDRTLAQAPDRPTVVAFHHPPFATGIGFMDRLGLRSGADECAAILARHQQVQRVICGHVHRALVVPFAGKIAMTAPSVAHQIPVAFDPQTPEAFVFEPPGWLLHRWDGSVMQSYVMPVERDGAPQLYR